MINSRGALAIAELAFYVPALLVALVVARKHGFAKSGGWYFLVALCIIRIVGCVCGILTNFYTILAVNIIFDILSSVGFSPLLLATIALLKRVNEGVSSGGKISPRIFNLLGLFPIVGMGLAIGAGIDIANQYEGSSPAEKVSTFQEGETLSHVSAIIYLVGLILVACAASWTAPHTRFIIPGDKILFYAAVLALPFLLVRVVYILLASYTLGQPTTQFSVLTGNIWIQAFMYVFEEFVVVILYLGAGLKAPKVVKAHVNPGQKEIPLQTYSQRDRTRGQEQGVFVE